MKIALQNTLIISGILGHAMRLHRAALRRAREYVPQHSLQTKLAPAPGFMAAWHLL